MSETDGIFIRREAKARARAGVRSRRRFRRAGESDRSEAILQSPARWNEADPSRRKDSGWRAERTGAGAALPERDPFPVASVAAAGRAAVFPADGGRPSAAVTDGQGTVGMPSRDNAPASAAETGCGLIYGNTFHHPLNASCGEPRRAGRSAKSNPRHSPDPWRETV